MYITLSSSIALPEFVLKASLYLYYVVTLVIKKYSNGMLSL